MAGGKKGCFFGLILGSILKLLVGIFKGVIFVLSWSIVYLGLWVPFLYAIVGLVLFFTVQFNPFEWTTWGQLYFAGFIASVVAALIITVRNIILKPLKSVSDGYKNPVWKRNTEKEEPVRETSRAPRAAARAEEPEDEMPPVRKTPRAYEESPLVYESELEHGSIVHEYSDRFEVFVLKNGRLVLDKVEMKNEEL